MRAWSVGLFCFGCLVLGLGIGITVMLSINTLLAEPETFVIWEVDEVRVPVHHTDYEIIQVPIFYPREVRVEVPAPIELRNFENLSELREWRDSLVLTFTGSMNNDCGNIALAVQRKASEDGYFISLWPRYDLWHMGNVAICGKSVYGFDETGLLTDGEIYLGKVR